MKVVILAGGFGTRISEESYQKPKPMIEIGGMPILWHIMKSYSLYGFNEFIICCGYKGHMIKQYFADYYLHRSDMTFDFTNNNTVTIHNNIAEPWKITVVDTGLNTMTGGRVKRIQKYVGEEPFFLTYGDGVSDIDIDQLLKFHKFHNKIVTITAVKPEGRFGVLDINEDNVINSFREKSQQDIGWINGGFMVCEAEIFNYIQGDEITFEKEPLEMVADQKLLIAYKHQGFWQCMDTTRDKIYLETLLEKNAAPWKKW
ncbi:MAG: glucose-1-phosphate cytidylyltransferase [Candidatus Epulonipiscioides saccharophilum]|nr:MAG: glucose-1-phosphate cytidylyltransferase [Epulopiscium sp. AS2M-Bin001]